MLDVTVVDSQEQSVELIPDKPTKKARAEAMPAIARLEGRITLGWPDAVPMTKALLKDDAATAAFLQQHADATFFLIQLACTFHHQDDTPFDQAWLRVQLQQADLQATPLAIAWSMSPEKVEDVQEVSNSIKLDSKFQILSIGQQVHAEGKVKTPVRTIQISARGLREPSPYWHFRRTPAARLEGSFRLALVARLPRVTATTAMVDFRATVTHRLLGIISYHSAVNSARRVINLGACDGGER